MKNTIQCLDVLEFTKEVPSDSIDLIITSPPYAERRKNVYGGVSADKYVEWFIPISFEFMRMLKPSGSFVLNIKESVKGGQRQTYVLEYLLKMAKQGWWVETFIWSKKNPFPNGNPKRLKDGFEYCYQFSKSKSYKFFPNNCLVPANPKWLADNLKRKNKGEHFVSNESGMNMAIRTVSENVRPSNVISLATNTTNTKHPATFPIDLPKFFINLMTEVGDIVCDPFVGSGQTILACIETGRDWIANDRDQKWVDLSKDRINKL